MFTVQDLCQLLPKHMTLSNCKKKKTCSKKLFNQNKTPPPPKNKTKTS